MRADGSIAAWGYNGNGEVKNVPTGTGFIAVGGDGDTDYALRPNGSIVAWGQDASGTVSNAPTGAGFTYVGGGGYVGFALESSAVVPEPNSLTLFALSLIAAIGRLYSLKLKVCAIKRSRR